MFTKLLEVLQLNKELHSLLCSVTGCITFVFSSVPLPHVIPVQLYQLMQREEGAVTYLFKRINFKDLLHLKKF